VTTVGLHVGATDESMAIVDLAVAAQERGFDAIFLPEHTHIPWARRTPWPGEGELPGRYLRLWDPLVALAFVAARTDLVIGTCVALPGGHDPIAYAKAVATLDVQSGGRLVLGVGFGWIDEELEDHGITTGRKQAVAIEKR
jgi:alkanesulfonate monooxygenase SsuD/methylene tetrahydromethanopterin reductase-like flavin-dependent oxidoreductase (luciferase family)